MGNAEHASAIPHRNDKKANVTRLFIYAWFCNGRHIPQGSRVLETERGNHPRNLFPPEHQNTLIFISASASCNAVTKHAYVNAHK